MKQDCYCFKTLEGCCFLCLCLQAGLILNIPFPSLPHDSLLTSRFSLILLTTSTYICTFFHPIHPTRHMPHAAPTRHMPSLTLSYQALYILSVICYFYIYSSIS